MNTAISLITMKGRLIAHTSSKQTLIFIKTSRFDKRSSKLHLKFQHVSFRYKSISKSNSDETGTGNQLGDPLQFAEVSKLRLVPHPYALLPTFPTL